MESPDPRQLTVRAMALGAKVNEKAFEMMIWEMFRVKASCYKVSLSRGNTTTTLFLSFTKRQLDAGEKDGLVKELTCAPEREGLQVKYDGVKYSLKPFDPDYSRNKAKKTLKTRSKGTSQCVKTQGPLPDNVTLFVHGVKQRDILNTFEVQCEEFIHASVPSSPGIKLFVNNKLSFSKDSKEFGLMSKIVQGFVKSVKPNGEDRDKTVLFTLLCNDKRVFVDFCNVKKVQEWMEYFLPEKVEEGQQARIPSNFVKLNPNQYKVGDNVFPDLNTAVAVCNALKGVGQDVRILVGNDKDGWKPLGEDGNYASVVVAKTAPKEANGEGAEDEEAEESHPVEEAQKVVMVKSAPKQQNDSEKECTADNVKIFVA